MANAHVACLGARDFDSTYQEGSGLLDLSETKPAGHRGSDKTTVALNGYLYHALYSLLVACGSRFYMLQARLGRGRMSLKGPSHPPKPPFLSTTVPTEGNVLEAIRGQPCLASLSARRKHFPFAAPHLPIRDSRAPLSNQRGHVILRRKTMDHSHYISQ